MLSYLKVSLYANITISVHQPRCTSASQLVSLSAAPQGDHRPRRSAHHPLPPAPARKKEFRSHQRHHRLRRDPEDVPRRSKVSFDNLACVTSPLHMIENEHTFIKLRL